MNAVDLVVTDLDGTLWHTDDEVHPDIVSALTELDRRDIPLLVATGRRVTSTRVPLARIGFVPPAVVLNGALALDLASGDRFHRAPFPPAQAAVVLAGFRSTGLDPCVYVDYDHLEVFVSDRPSTNPGHLAALGPSAEVRDLEAIITDATVLGFSIIGVPLAVLEPAEHTIKVAAACFGCAHAHRSRPSTRGGRPARSMLISAAHTRLGHGSRRQTIRQRVAAAGTS